ncbi:hypothetical protein VKI21_15045 [Cyanobacterium aponinum UTEX 3222]|uniref:hypothetical protein n=1 Tax=Cyanobacterium aponinum TaxID=379064 RepID=UPI0030860E50|nr:hypothetical protein VKI21_15045 [Cyanobacterium aponinum UTEX 3222]
MQLTTKKININNSTLNTLIVELKEECHNVLSLINQLEISELSDRQKGKILSELLVSSIYLDSHCNKDFQDLISDELETLHD